MALGGNTDMSTKLLTIYDTFSVPEKGTVIVGRSPEESVALTANDAFILRLPSGEARRLIAEGVEPFTKCFSNATQVGVLIGSQIRPEEVPRESEVWSE
jgi:hypothetical protein